MPRPEINDPNYSLTAGNGKGAKIAIMRQHHPVPGERGSKNANIGSAPKVNIVSCDDVTPFLP